jgi:hypothetical protein
MNQLISKLEKEKEADLGMLPSCKKSFARDGKVRADHQKTHGLQRDHLTTVMEKLTQRDDMLNYQYALVEYGMLFFNFSCRCTIILMFPKGDARRSSKYMHYREPKRYVPNLCPFISKRCTSPYVEPVCESKKWNGRQYTN